MEREKYFPFYMSFLQNGRGRMQTEEAAQPAEDPMRREMMDADWEEALIRSYYPVHVQRMQGIVEELCDEMDYDGSMIYDEYPDPYLLNRAADRIMERWTDEYPDDRIESEEWGGRPGRRPNRRPFDDLARVLLLHEIARRRCRGRRCRRYF